MDSLTTDVGKKFFASRNFQCFPTPHKEINNNTDDDLRCPDWTNSLTSPANMPPSPPESSNESGDNIIQGYLDNKHYQPNNQIHKAKEIDENSTNFFPSVAVQFGIEANQKRTAKLNSPQTTFSTILRSPALTGEDEKSPEVSNTEISLQTPSSKRKRYSRELKNLECGFKNTNALVGESRNARVVATIALQESINNKAKRKRRIRATKYDFAQNSDDTPANGRQAATVCNHAQITSSSKLKEEEAIKPILAENIRNSRQTFFRRSNQESPPDKQHEKQNLVSPIILKKRRVPVIGESWSIANKMTTSESLLNECPASQAETIIFDHKYNSKDSKTKLSKEAKNISTEREQILSLQIQAIVQLKRLSPTLIKQLQIGNESARLSTTSKINSRCLRKKETQSILLNNNPRMVYTSTGNCKLCKTRPRDLTFHYISRHKTESFVSRLTVAKLEQTNFAIAMPSRKHFQFKEYTVICKFCNEDIEDTFERLYDHYSTHTGEYAFKCAVCSKVMPFEEDIISHQLNDRDCRNGEVDRIYTYSSNLSAIYLYSCVHCNFVQMNKSNVIEHLNVHHNQSDARSIKKYKLTERDVPVINPPLTVIHVTNPITEMESIFPPVSYHKPMAIEAGVKTEENETKDIQSLDESCE